MPSECVLGTMPAILLQGCIIIVIIVLNFKKKICFLLLTESEVIIEDGVKVSGKAMENMRFLDLEPKNCIALIVDRGI